MNFISIVLLASLLAFVNTYGQNTRFDYPAIKLLTTEQADNDNDFVSTLVSNYVVEGEHLRLTEARLKDENDVGKILKSRIASLEQCKFSKALLFKEKEVGQLHKCTKRGTNTLIYSYGEKFYEVSSKSSNAISLFTKHVLPINQAKPKYF